MDLDRVTVVGSGAGGMAVAGALAEGDSTVTLADLEAFPANLAAIGDRGGIRCRHQDEATPRLIPVEEVTTDVAGAVASAPTAVVVAPLMGHAALLDAMGDAAAKLDGLLFVGEGGGAIRMRARAAQPRSVAELNTLPYLARVEGAGAVMVRPKSGGVFVAGAPAADGAAWQEVLAATWPWVAAADDVYDTTLANYNVIDHVPTVLANAGYLEAGTGPWRLWGEGCTPAVARGIDALDAELQTLRGALELPSRRYGDCLAAQGFAPHVEATLHATIQGSVLRDLEVERNPQFLESRFIMEDVPHGLVLIESIAAAHGVTLPLCSSLITLASVLVGEDLRAAGTTLASLGLPTEAAALDDLLRGGAS